MLHAAHTRALADGAGVIIGKHCTSRCCDASFHGSAACDVNDGLYAFLAARQPAVMFVACGVLLTSNNMKL